MSYLDKAGLEYLWGKISGAIGAESLERQRETGALSDSVSGVQSAVDAEASTRSSGDNALADRLSAEESARATADAGLQSQINQIVSPSGEAPSAAEVTNARIGSDGYTYSSLGNAIRTQDSDLNMAVGNLTDQIILKQAVSIFASSDGWRLNESVGLCYGASEYHIVKYRVSGGSTIYVESNDRFFFQAVASVPSTGTSNKIGDTYIAYTGLVNVPSNANYLVMSALITGGIANCYTVTDKDESTAVRDLVPDLINGSALNHANVNAVTPKVVLPIAAALKSIYAIYSGEFPEGSYIIWSVQGFTSEAVGMDAIEAQAAGYMEFNSETTRPANDRTVNIMSMLPSTAKAFSVSPFVFKSDGSRIPLRIATHQHCIRIWQDYIVQDGTENSYAETELASNLDSARHVSNNSVSPLTLFHFSDIHHDVAALGRLMDERVKLGSKVDDAICTGDMAANTAEEISSWWNSGVMTCIGNHDTASYNSVTGYNWTALSMANRAAYYITPFEGSWGIVRNSGASYYYKDYASQNVRLIVMDVMLYMSSDATQANIQTSWLSSLLSEAITNGLHVLIAIHCPHGGATAKECSFSRYGQEPRPVMTDCDTPQTIINAVATAINNGLHFIGYIVGHTHQDNVWDAEGDGSQLMYCVTCAAVAQTAQWSYTDMHRDEDHDAYNLVTIDTAHTLVKIVRGGGADMDDHMRTRKAICINYSTGDVVGEVL